MAGYGVLGVGRSLAGVERQLRPHFTTSLGGKGRAGRLRRINHVIGDVVDDNGPIVYYFACILKTPLVGVDGPVVQNRPLVEDRRSDRVSRAQSHVMHALVLLLAALST